MAVTKVTGAWPEADGVTLEEVNGTLKVKQITSNLLKTNTGDFIATFAAGGTAVVQLNDYSFFPNISSDGDHFEVRNWLTFETDTVGRISLHNLTSSDQTAKVYWRYVTSSEPPVIFVIPGRAVWVSEPVRDKNNNIMCPIMMKSKDGKVEHGEGFETPKELLGKPAPEIAEMIMGKKLDVSSLERLKCKVIIR